MAFETINETYPTLPEEDPRKYGYIEGYTSNTVGAQALKACDNTLTFVMPVCGHCGEYIGAVAIREAPETFGRHSIGPRDIFIAYDFDPWRCPKCETPFVRADLDLAERKCVLNGETQADATARDNLVAAVLAEVEECMRAYEDDDDGYILKKCEFEFFMREIKNEYLKGETNT